MRKLGHRFADRFFLAVHTHQHILHMSDMLSQGIIKQFSARFR